MTTEEILVEKIGNLATVLEQDMAARKKKNIVANILLWSSAFISVGTAITVLSSPFVDLSRRTNKLEDKVDKIEYVVWKHVEGADEFLQNPYRSNGSNNKKTSPHIPSWLLE